MASMAAGRVRPIVQAALDHRRAGDDSCSVGYLRQELPKPVRKMSDDRQYAPATLRNRDFILDVLAMSCRRRASSLRSHMARANTPFICEKSPEPRFQPSDSDPDARLSVAAWVEGHRCHESTRAHCPGRPAFGLANRISRRDYLHNMIHISPWEATVGLIKGAAAILPSRSPLYLHGPYKREGFETAPSNQAFDQSLRDRNPDWELRDHEAVAAMVQTLGFADPAITEMSTNNLSVVFRRM
jgi:Protein of unknown function (DUF938)